ncbi:hypothetical protein CCM_04253 [Cordyceps militaris CM01]|uniref:Uncharacterized protein n=1 Tax=Cordyceps militaris (strain CM01) TaxID=983644 RepID=G3JE56_CORMM|nr:uncharacterized protein CCM_04253 [Cordyceps militaris CM01]EGX92881.1 hypothetical protein CCM_04253 [Cordyceps militaris CM01]
MASTRYLELQRSGRLGAMKEEEETLLEQNDAGQTFVSRSSTTRRVSSVCRKSTMVLKDLILLGLAIPTLITLFQSSVTHFQHASAPGSGVSFALPGCNCGDSVAQAVELNCQYDTLAAAWLPPHCRDDELTAEFDAFGDGPNGTWMYWADAQHTKAIAVQDLGALADRPRGGPFYTTHRWHLMHCFFYWRKSIRAKSRGTMLELRYENDGHAKHCAQMLGADGNKGAQAGVVLNSNRWEALG